MLKMVLIGVALVILTTIIQAGFMYAGIHTLAHRFSGVAHSPRLLPKALLVSVFTAWMFLGMVIESLVWAAYYLVNANIVLPDVATAVYFSLVTFTTVGYGDVVVSGDWRLLAALQAANGAILFGWTTALIFYVIQKVYRQV